MKKGNVQLRANGIIPNLMRNFTVAPELQVQIGLQQMLLSRIKRDISGNVSAYLNLSP